MTKKLPGTILTVYAEASGVRFQLFDRSPALKRLARGSVTSLGGAPSFAATDETSHVVDKKILSTTYSHETGLNIILDWIKKKNLDWQITAVAHRVVQGGDVFRESVRVTPDVVAQIKTLTSLAPRHAFHNLEAITAITKMMPEMPQIACFDTAFHTGHDPLFTEYALPQRMRSKGVRRYGFQGLSYEWIATVLKRDEPALSRGRVIIAHLGNTASLCAMRDGISIDTTMGMTTLEGLPTGTRSGSIDPGALIYILREFDMPISELERILYDESGLLGLSDKTSEMKPLQDDKNNPKAQFAVDYFALKVAQSMGTLAVALGGLDGIIFTGGVGENSIIIREKILNYVGFLKPFEMRIIRANEERMMATHAQSLLSLPSEDSQADEHADEQW